MRILHVGLSSIMGGIESVALNYMRELNKQGVVFDFVDIYGAGIVEADEISALGGRIFTLPNFKRHPIKSIRAMRKVMECSDYDCVHIHLASEVNFLPLLAAKMAGIKPVAHVHFSAPEDGIRKFAFALLKGIFRGIPSYHFACGIDAGKWFWNDDNFFVLTNCVDIDRFAFKAEARQRLRSEFGVDEDTVALGYVGRFEPVKNPLFALEVLRACKDSYPDSKVKLFAAGTGSLAEEFVRQTDAMNLSDSVRYLGYRSDIGELLSAMDVFLMPSLHEGVSLASVEAQTSGLTCLFSESIPLENKILNDAAFLPLSAALWTEQIAQADPKRRRDGSGEMAKTKYNIAISATELLKVYERIGCKVSELNET